jgi:hypothetical protein
MKHGARRIALVGGLVAALALSLALASCRRDPQDLDRVPQEVTVHLKCEPLDEASLTQAEKDAMVRLKSLEGAEDSYIESHHKLGDVKALSDEGLISGGDEVGGYHFSVLFDNPATGLYGITAEPLHATIGRHGFTISDDGVIRYQNGAVAPGRDNGCPVCACPK